MSIVTPLVSIAQSFRRVYWWIVKPSTVGVRAIILNEINEVLLVKHTYHTEWYLPGGAVKRNETLENAIIREMEEEVGITCKTDELTYFSTYSNIYEHKKDIITVFLIRNYKQNQSSDLEIEEYKFYSINAIPSNISRGTKRRLNEFFNDTKHDDIW